MLKRLTKLRGFAYLPLFTAALIGCSQTMIRSSDCDLKSGSYEVPSGWKRDFPKYSSSQNILKRTSPTEANYLVIAVDLFCSFTPGFPKTQEGCAEGYLSGIHDVESEEVRLEKYGVIRNPWHGSINIYRFFDGDGRDNLVAMVVTSSGFVTAELCAESAVNRRPHEGSFYELVRSIDIRGIRRSVDISRQR